jgi:hypothetical protein
MTFHRALRHAAAHHGARTHRRSGRSALEQLAALLENPDHQVSIRQTLGCEIITRETCGMPARVTSVPTKKVLSYQVKKLSGRES